MSSAIRKKRGRKVKPIFDLTPNTLKRHAIASLIKRLGIEIVYYTYCLDNDLIYIMDRLWSLRCSEYFCSGKEYNMADLSLEAV